MSPQRTTPTPYDWLRRSPRPQRPKRSVWLLLVLLLLWSLCLGIGLAQAVEPASARLLSHVASQVSSKVLANKTATAAEQAQAGAVPPEPTPADATATGWASSAFATELAQAESLPTTPTRDAAVSDPIGTVDVVPARYLAGQKLYLANCATCHLGIPPAVMPSETWRQLIQDPEHYGATLTPLAGPDLQITWQYLRDFSRPDEVGESIPYRIHQSKFFKALHPRVKFTQRVTLESCNTCHPGGDKYDFRTLSAEWQNAP
jgi:mono/diheme cytochrome c family protein